MVHSLNLIFKFCGFILEHQDHVWKYVVSQEWIYELSWFLHVGSDAIPLCIFDI